MKNNLLSILLLISSFGFAQQVLKKITETDDYTVVEMYTIRNGTNNSNITGNKNFINRDNSDFVNFYDDDLKNFISNWNSNQLSGIKAHIENVCNATLPLNESLSFGISAGEYYDWRSNGGLYKYQFINTKRFKEQADTNNDGLIDCYKATLYIPKKLQDGTLIPSTNIWSTAVGLRGNYVCDTGGVCNIAAGNLWFKFNGTTWVLQTIRPDGSPADLIKDVCNSLSISENNKNERKILIYPNPTNNNVTVKNLNNSTEKFEYKIIYLAGRIIKTGTSNFNEVISVESLTSGSYFIQIETEDEQLVTEKIIKN
jgi:hypothetical protein